MKVAGLAALAILGLVCSVALGTERRVRDQAHPQAPRQAAATSPRLPELAAVTISAEEREVSEEPAAEQPDVRAILLRVVDAAGLPVAGAQLDVHTSGWTRSLWTDESGDVVLADSNVPELLRLTGSISCAGFLRREFELFADNGTVRISGSEVSQTELCLWRAARVSGFVFTAEGTPLVDVEVTASEGAFLTEATCDLIRSAASQSTRTDNDGAYSLDSLPAERTLHWRVAGHTELADLDCGTTRRDFNLPVR